MNICPKINLLFLLVLFFTLLMTYTCTSPCIDTFASRGGLTRHQNTCATFRAAQEHNIQQRRLLASRTKPKKTRAPGPYPGTKPGRISNGEESSGSSTNLNVALSQGAQPVDASITVHSAAPPSTPSQLPEHPPFVPPPLPEVLIPQSSRNIVRQPLRFDDELPQHSVPIPVVPPPAPRVIRRVILHVRELFRSVVNRFHVLREYRHRPSYDPDAYIKLEDLANFRLNEPPNSDNPSTSQSPPLPPWPFENTSKYLLMNWFHSGGNQKSEGEVNRLVKEVLTALDFRPGDLADFTIRQGNKVLDDAYADGRTRVPHFQKMAGRNFRWILRFLCLSQMQPQKHFKYQVFTADRSRKSSRVLGNLFRPPNFTLCPSSASTSTHRLARKPEFLMKYTPPMLGLKLMKNFKRSPMNLGASSRKLLQG